MMKLAEPASFIKKLPKRRIDVNLFNFIIWLSVGAVIGWLASRMFEAENRRIYKRIPVRVSSS
jgi:hypothetical protein